MLFLSLEETKPTIMSLNVNKLKNAIVRYESRQVEGIDTSLLLEELRRTYKRTGQSVEINFREVVDWVRLGDQLTHQIHPYPAKLLPNIAHFFVSASSLHKRGRKILDPFCGSGTVALEASLAGAMPYVADANPLALLIAKVKTTPFDVTALRAIAKKIVARAVRLKTAPEIAIVNASLWYSPNTKKDLEIIMRAVMELADGDQRDFFRICLSVTARRLSRTDPAIAVPVRLKTKARFSDVVNEKIAKRLAWIENTQACEEFFRVCHANIDRVEESNQALGSRVCAVEVGTDARCLMNPASALATALPDASMPLIITSPPYGSAQKYIRSTSLSLNWLGLAGPGQLSSLEGQSIGREHAPLYRKDDAGAALPAQYESMIARVKQTNALRAHITRQYLHEMRLALIEMVRVTAKGGNIVLVIGNNSVCGEPLHNDEFFSYMLQEQGMKLDLSLVDHIKSRGLMTKRNKTASVISRECVMVFSK